MKDFIDFKVEIAREIENCRKWLVSKDEAEAKVLVEQENVEKAKLAVEDLRIAYENALADANAKVVDAEKVLADAVLNVEDYKPENIIQVELHIAKCEKYLENIDRED